MRPRARLALDDVRVLVGDDAHRDGAERRGEVVARLEALAVQRERLLRAVAGEVVREGEADPEGGGDLRGVAAGSQQPHLRAVTEPRDGRDPAQRVVVRHAAREEADQVDQLLREVVDAEARLAAAERHRGRAVGAGGPADAEVDAVAVERAERPELLGDDERRVVRQHDAAAADADGGGAGGDARQEDGRGGARDPRHAVVLGHPEPRVPRGLGCLREADAAPDRVRVRAAEGTGSEVEDVQGHAFEVGHPGENGRDPRRIPRRGALLGCGPMDPADPAPPPGATAEGIATGRSTWGVRRDRGRRRIRRRQATALLLAYVA
ncbi:hypothetical protein MAFF212519_20670 [Clavibacter michiganensis]